MALFGFLIKLRKLIFRKLSVELSELSHYILYFRGRSHIVTN